jgi:hypothetical protein
MPAAPSIRSFARTLPAHPSNADTNDRCMNRFAIFDITVRIRRCALPNSSHLI